MDRADPCPVPQNPDVSWTTALPLRQDCQCSSALLEGDTEGQAHHVSLM